jgi:hypothetical protein
MADSKNRCFWSKVDSRGICISADYAEVRANAAASGLRVFRSSPCIIT